MTKSKDLYNKALQALRNKDYRTASGFFKSAENQFADNLDFRILNEVTALLVAVKDELNELESNSFVVEEVNTDGQETKLFG